VTRINPGIADAFAATSAIAVAATSLPALAAWQPTRPVEFIVPAGTGGGADQMARVIQGIVQKHNLMPQPLVVINKAGGAGAEGFLDVKGSARNPHKIIITLSNLFTTPLATGVPFRWEEMTPVAMLALDEFILWVNAKAPFKAAVAQWRAGELRALCVFDAQRIPLKEKVTETQSWGDIPTCKEQGLDIEYLMLRGIFMTPGATPDQVAFYVDLFKKVRETPEWKDFMEKGAFNTTFMSGDEYRSWVAKAAETHRSLMEKAGFLAKS
jgi:tripartite-type tricarboxylate transporter receptor subunit TctC